MYAHERVSETAVSYVPTSQRDSGRALAIAFDRAAAHRCDETMRELQLAARQFVERLKTDGLPPERVVVTVKALLRAGDRHEWAPSLDAPAEHEPAHAQAAVYTELFHWCLDAYFGERHVAASDAE